MKKIMNLVAVMALALAGAVTLTAGAGGHVDKVWVCKYVGTPGVDETLKVGNDGLVYVSENAIKDWPVAVGSYFNDAQGRSLVVQIGGARPNPSVCPGYVTPTPEPSVTPTPEPSVTPTPEPSVTPSATPTPEPSVTPTPEPSVTPSTTPTPEPSVTPTPEPSVTPSTTPVATSAETTPTPNATPVVSKVGTVAPTALAETGASGSLRLFGLAMSMLVVGLVGILLRRRHGRRTAS